MDNLYHNKFFAMNTRFQAIFYGMDDDTADKLFRAVKEEVYRIEAKLSRFEPESELSQINKHAAAGPRTADEELFEVLQACRYCWELTGRAFDLTLRPLMEFWKTHAEDAFDEEELNALKTNLGMQHVQLDEETQTVYFENPGVELDLGGFGKGYALEKVSEILLKSGVKSGFISFGESSVLALGNHPAGGAWKIGINNYAEPGRPVHQFNASGASVSTSGNFYVDKSGVIRNHGHVIDPVTARPFMQCSSVSVLAGSPVLAEMLSTAFLILPDDKVESILELYEGVEAIRVVYKEDGIEKKYFENKLSNKQENCVHQSQTIS